MDSVFVMKKGDDALDRRRLTARTIVKLSTAESQTALGRIFTRWLRRRPDATRRSPVPCEMWLEQSMAVHA